MTDARIMTLLLATAAAPAMAQPAAPISGAAAQQGDATSGTVGHEQTQLEDIIVTATRREENLQNVPIAVTAVTAKSLEASGITNVRDATQVIPNLTFSRNQAFFQPFIRGVGSTSTTLGDESNVSLYVDGVYFPDATGAAFDLVEIQRIEVLRGPQGTLFGRNSTGGLINVITKEPVADPSITITGRYGRFDERSVRVYATGALTSKLLADFAFQKYNDNGYITDLVRGGKINPRRTTAGRAKLLYEASDTVTFHATINYSHQDDPTGPTAYPINGDTLGRAANPAVLIAPGPFNSAVTLVPIIKNRQLGGSLRGSFKFEPFTAEVTYAHNNSKTRQRIDSDYTPQLLNSSEIFTQTISDSVEARLLSASTGRFTWTAGVFGFKSHTRSTINLNNRTFLAPYSNTQSIAGYGEGVFAITDSLKVTAGARYTYEKKRFIQTVSNNQLFDVHHSDSQPTGRVAVQYEFAPRANVYATYSTGFKSGLYNTSDTRTTTVKPEKIRSYEAGIKASPLPWLRTNVAAFLSHYDDLQVSARDPSGIYTLQNAAKAKIRGVEVEMQVVPFQGLTLNASGSLLKARYVSFPNAPFTTPLPAGGNRQFAGDASGNHLVRAPAYSANLSAQYTHPLGNGEAGGSVSVFHSARVYWDFANTLFQKPYNMINGEIFWSPNEKYRFSIWANNLANEVVAQLINTSATATFRVNEKPRRAGVMVRATF